MTEHAGFEFGTAADLPITVTTAGPRRDYGLRLTNNAPAGISIEPREVTAYRWRRPGATGILRILIVQPGAPVNMLLADAEPPYDIHCRTEAESEWRPLYEVRPTSSGLIMHSCDG